MLDEVQHDGFGYGHCGSRVDFKSDDSMPCINAMGGIALISFYFNARYGMQISQQQHQLPQIWIRIGPYVSANVPETV